MNNFYLVTRPIGKRAATNNLPDTMADLKQKQRDFERGCLFFGLGFLAGAAFALIIPSILFN